MDSIFLIFFKYSQKTLYWICIWAICRPTKNKYLFLNHFFLDFAVCGRALLCWKMISLSSNLNLNVCDKEMNLDILIVVDQ